MSVSKRLRFEIFRRDNHQCRYCGTPASAAPLTIDHVIPTALGGTDDPSNLVAACEDCNSGKSASSPDAALVAEVADDALRWARAQHAAAEAMLAALADRDALRQEFKAAWNRWEGRNGEPMPLPAQWPESIDRFMTVGLPMPILLDCLDKAMRNLRIRDPFRYMCGVAWKQVGNLQQAATRTLAPQAAARIDVNSPYKDAINMLLGQLRHPEKLSDPEYLRLMAGEFDAVTEYDEDSDGNPVDYSSWGTELKAIVQSVKTEFDELWEWQNVSRYVVGAVLKDDHQAREVQAREAFKANGVPEPGLLEVQRYALTLAVRDYVNKTTPQSSTDPWDGA